MRVIAGIARSMPLKAAEGDNTRPTTDRIKETLFNMLQSDIAGCRFLDLYSGSGAIGIEALSRGAKEAVLVENARQAIAVIKDNLTFTKLSPKAVVMEQDVLSADYQAAEYLILYLWIHLMEKTMNMMYYLHYHIRIL